MNSHLTSLCFAVRRGSCTDNSANYVAADSESPSIHRHALKRGASLSAAFTTPKHYAGIHVFAALETSKAETEEAPF